MLGTGIFESILFFIISLVYLFFPPKKINFFYGYRTRKSMKSQKNWYMANYLASRILLLFSIISCIFTFIGYIFTDNAFSVFVTTLTISFVFTISIVEYRLD